MGWLSKLKGLGNKIASSPIGKSLIDQAKQHALEYAAQAAGGGMRHHKRRRGHGHLVKGSARAHAHMAMLRAMRRR